MYKKGLIWPLKFKFKLILGVSVKKHQLLAVRREMFRIHSSLFSKIYNFCHPYQRRILKCFLDNTIVLLRCMYLMDVMYDTNETECNFTFLQVFFWEGT